MTIAQLFVKCLEEEGVKHVFGVPGEETEDLIFALNDSKKIEFVPCRHEQGAAFIANAWGRLCGKAGVCLSTLGPGATNLITGIADANLDKAPVVAITGQGGITRLHHESHQNIDVVNMYAPITKWNSTIRSPQTTPEVVRKAFKVAEMEKPGATHIELPEDIAQMQADESLQPLKPSLLRRPAPDNEAVLNAIHLIKEASYPLILAGNGAIRTRASEALTTFVKFTDYPVVSTFMGKGAVRDDLPQSLLSVGLGFKDYVMEAFEKADLIITIGYDIAEYSPTSWNPKGDKKIINIDFEPAEVYTNYQPEVEIIGDIATIIRELYHQISRGNKYGNEDIWYSDIRQRIVDDIDGYKMKEPEKNIHVPGIINIVREHLPENGLLISDVGTHKMWIARNFKTYCPNGCMISNGLASMGIALPAGIAATMLDQERPVVVMAGDGGFMMNIQELATAKKLGVGFTMIVMTDDDYGLISWKQQQRSQRTAGTTLTNPDFVKLAESFGIKASRPETAEELDAQIKESIESKELRLIEVSIDTSVNGALTDKLNAYFSKTTEEETESQAPVEV